MRKTLILVAVVLVSLLASGEGPGESLIVSHVSAADAPQVQDCFLFPSKGLRVKSHATLLAIDKSLLPLQKDLALHLNTPEVREEPVLTASKDDPAAPDSLAAHFYGSVLHDQGHYRMWYYSVSQDLENNKLRQGPVCYAESEDGLNWVKPDLGQVEFAGSRHNNAIALEGSILEGVQVIRDEDDPEPSRRYKMIYNVMNNGGYFTTRTATSADGLHWTCGPDTYSTEFIEQSAFFKHNGYYMINAQALGFGESGKGRGRQAYAWVSPDFDNWIESRADSFILPEPPENPIGNAWAGWGGNYDQVHLGVGATSFGSVVVGLYGLWHERGWGEGGTSCDLGLVVSSDGVHFEEPVKGFAYLPADASAMSAVPGKNYPSILCQSGGGILNVGDETFIYHGRWRNAGEDSQEYGGEIALATLPRDRWGALKLAPGKDAGELWSAPITLPQDNCQVLLNADSAKSINVDIADENFQLMPEFSADNSGKCSIESGIEVPVNWTSEKLSSLAGKTVRLRLRIHKEQDISPELYAIYLTSTNVSQDIK